MFNILMYLPWGKVPETTCQELWQKREIVQIVDVRSAQEFKHRALLQIEIWVDDVPFKKYLETENPVD